MGGHAVSYRRIVVVGVTGSGKTVLAGRLSACLAIPHVELDAIHWGPGWRPVGTGVFRARTEEALSGDAWVADGNYGKVRDIVWGRADTVVWLDHCLPVILARLARRTIRRVMMREVLWNGNRETFREQFLSRDSLFVWALKTYWKRRRLYPALFKRPEYAHLRVVRLRTAGAEPRWLGTVPETRGKETPR